MTPRVYRYAVSIKNHPVSRQDGDKNNITNKFKTLKHLKYNKTNSINPALRSAG